MSTRWSVRPRHFIRYAPRFARLYPTQDAVDVPKVEVPVVVLARGLDSIPTLRQPNHPGTGTPQR